MAFARLALFPNGTEEQHRAIVEALGDAQVNPDGRILFAAGPTEEGWHILQIWESREQLEQWVQQYLGAAFAAVGGRGYPAPPRITDFEVHDLLLPATLPTA
jgi:hypothetical protein